MICIGTNPAGERCKQIRMKSSSYCLRHDPDTISVQSFGDAELEELEFFFDDVDMHVSEKETKIEFKIPDQEHLAVINVEGDGYCFWRALSVCLYGDQYKYEGLAKTCLHLKDENETISLTWVEFHEIPIISKLLKITINVIHYMENEIYLYICLPDGKIENIKYPCELDPSDKNVYIYFVPGHYTSVVKI